MDPTRQAWWLRPIIPATKATEAVGSKAEGLPGLLSDFKAGYSKDPISK